MLSFIFRLIQDFEKEHNIKPNLIYLNKDHVRYLVNGFSDEINLQDIVRFLQVDLIIDNSVSHPHAAWSQVAYQHAV